MANMQVTRMCPICGTKQQLVVDESAYKAWCSGMYIQDAFPDLNEDQREVLKTGICASCWDKMFKNQEATYG